MKIVRSLIVALLASVVASGAAHAATVTTDLGTVAAGQSNSAFQVIDFTGSKGSFAVSGYVPSETEIVFTYTLVPSAANATHGAYLNNAVNLTGSSSYNYTSHGVHYKGSSSSTDGVSPASASSSTGSASSLVLASANIASNTVGTTTIINNSASIASFLSTITAVAKLYGKVTVSYAVTSLVPLPASLSMFVLALVAVVVYGFKRKAAQAPFVG